MARQCGVRVNAVLPGWIDSAMGAEAAGVAQEAKDKSPLDRNGTSAEVAQLVIFLLSERASYMNGASITLDGGYSVVDEVLKREYEAHQK